MCCVGSGVLHKRLGLLAHSQNIRNKSFLAAPLCLVVIGGTDLSPLSPTMEPHLHYHTCTDFQAAIFHRHVLERAKSKELTPA